MATYLGLFSLVLLCGHVSSFLVNSPYLPARISRLRHRTLDPAPECTISAEERLGCGPAWLTEVQCHALDCCWSHSRLPRCYHSTLTPENLCTRTSVSRIPCETETDGKDQCLAVGCCWQPSNVSPVWCFNPTGINPLKRSRVKHVQNE